MAKISGIELKNHRALEGKEGYGFSADIYLDEKKAGEVYDYADGSIDYTFRFVSPEKEVKVTNTVTQYFKKNPSVDVGKIYETPISDIDMEHLPIMDMMDTCFELTVFFEKLADLTVKEQEFRKGIVDGYSQLVYIGYYSVAGIPTPKDSLYYCPTNFKTENILKKAREQHKTAHMTVYRSLEDFVLI